LQKKGHRLLHVPHRRVRGDRRHDQGQPGALRESLVRAQLHKQGDPGAGRETHCHIRAAVHSPRRGAHLRLQVSQGGRQDPLPVQEQQVPQIPQLNIT
jgi:hypothetical protein